DTTARLASNLRSEPSWQARLENVRLLSARRDHPAAREGLSRACSDERTEVRLEAAEALGGEDGHAALIEIASRESSDDALAARAVVSLDERATRDLLSTVLRNALRTRRLATARACLQKLGRSGGPEVVPRLASVLALEGGDLAAPAAEALGASGAASAEAPLLAALAHSEAEVRVAAATALGRAGSVAAVLPLQEAGERHRFDGALRRACRQSVAEIQARLHDASPGQLSLSER